MTVVARGRAALLGHTGFVGSNLSQQHPFDHRFNSSNIEGIKGGIFDLVVCAAAPGTKWRANSDPAADAASIHRLMEAIATVRTGRFVLISTVDVFADPVSVHEDSPPTRGSLTPYGRHRLELEEFVAAHFPSVIVRLPGVYGTGLKKNVIFDLIHGNDLAKVDSRGRYQFYPLARLWGDVGIALANELPTVHLATEPVTVEEVARVAFGRLFHNELPIPPANYDLKTRYAPLFGGAGDYVQSRTRTLEGIRAFVEQERAVHEERNQP